MAPWICRPCATRSSHEGHWQSHEAIGCKSSRDYAAPSHNPQAVIGTRIMSIFTHVCIGAQDLSAAKSFYDAALGALGIVNLEPESDDAGVYGREAPELIVLTPLDGKPASAGNGGTLGFSATSPEQVDAFHAAGLENGGSDAGAPGPRDFAPNVYAAYLRDPTGHKIGAFCFGSGA